METLVIKLPALITEMVSLVIGSPTLVIRKTTLVIGPPDINHLSNGPSRQSTSTGYRNDGSHPLDQWPSHQMWWGKPLCVFVKRFTTFYTGFYDQWKIFYKFGHILPANKHLKIEKHFSKNILLQNKRSVSN